MNNILIKMYFRCCMILLFLVFVIIVFKIVLNLLNCFVEKFFFFGEIFIIKSGI